MNESNIVNEYGMGVRMDNLTRQHIHPVEADLQVCCSTGLQSLAMDGLRLGGGDPGGVFSTSLRATFEPARDRDGWYGVPQFIFEWTDERFEDEDEDEDEEDDALIRHRIAISFHTVAALDIAQQLLSAMQWTNSLHGISDQDMLDLFSAENLPPAIPPKIAHG